MTGARTGLIVALAISLGVAVVSYGQAVDTGRPADGPRYAASGELVRPADYRDWVYLSSGLNMTYGANPRGAATNLPFNNVFVNRPAYRSFVDTGKWPEKTIFILEIRRSEQHVRPDNFGYTQGAISLLEAAVKDSEKNGANPWAYYSFDSASGLTATAKPQPATGSCQQCHAQHTAVEQTFVQFYPVLFDVAKAKGTVKSTWNPKIEPQAAPAQVPSFLGEWTATAKTPGGDVSETLRVVRSSKGFEITVKRVGTGQDGPEAGPGTDIVLDGDKFSYKRSVTMPAGTLVISYSGTVSGDKFTGTVNLGGLAEAPYTGVRTKPEEGTTTRE